MSTELDKTSREIFALSKSIQPLFAGRDPFIVGGVLADLLSLLIASVRPDLREEFLRLHLDTMRSLIPASEQQIAESLGGLPEAWTR